MGSNPMLRRLVALMPKAAPALTFSVVGSCVSNSSSLNFGALSAGAIQAGDLAVYIDMGASGSTVTAVTPTDFTNRIDTGSATVRGMLSTKKLTGSEGSVTGMNAAQNQKIGLVFRPSSAFTSIVANDIASELTNTNPALQTCDPSAETSAVILLTIAGVDGATAAFSTRSPAADANVATADNDLLVGYNIFNTSPQSVQADMNDLGANWLASLYLTVS